MAPWDQPNGYVPSNGNQMSKNMNSYAATSTAPQTTPLRWNAAALLNPRGEVQAKQQANGNPFTNQGPSPNLAFQFDSPAASSQSSPQISHAQTPSPYNSPGSNGHGAYINGGGAAHLLERVHNVADRGSLPVKRQKIYHEHQGERKATFAGGSQNGVIGQYMKEKREEGRKEGIANGTMVDLSKDDDEDLVLLENPEEREVCYGRIEGAEINAHKVPTPKPGVKALAEGFWPQVKIVLRRKQGDKSTVISAIDDTRITIGCVDVNTSIGLAPLLDSHLKVRTAARVLTRPKREGDLPAGSDISARYSLDLTLYGPRKHALKVGQWLSQKQLWLRAPLFVETGLQVYNPHDVQKPPQAAPRYLGYANRMQGPVRTTEEIRSDVLGMFDSLERSENLQEMDPDPRITTELLKHQKQGLYFMTNKEKSRVFGADEKGNSSLWRLHYGNNGEKSYFNVITGQTERDNPPQVLGGILADMMGLGKTLSILSLVVTTLDQATEWAKQAPCRPQAREASSSKKGKAPPLPVCGPADLALNTKATLLVSPLSTIANWEEQIKQHIKPGTLKYYIYHGASRTKDVAKLADYDLVITTYGSVASEFNHRSKKKQGSYPLEEINWFRIVLDEAHMIREQSTQQSKAICRLAAQRRWAVTGTPVQNRLEDLGALMTFLRIKPFDEKGGFSQYIMSPFKSCDPEILPKLRLLVDSITLRRLKDRIDLPPRHDKLVKLNFDEEERKLYDVFAKNAKDRVKVITGQREKQLGGKSYVHILQSILRLRLICAHGKDLLGEEDLKVMSGLSKDSAIDLDSDEEDDGPALSAKQAYDMYNLMKETNADVCILCSHKIGPNDAVESDAEPKDEVIGHMTPCYHIACNGCIDKFRSDLEYSAQGRSRTDCPFCQQSIKICLFALRQGGIDEDQDSRIRSKENAKHGKETLDYSGPHTKTKALIHDLLISEQESELKPLEPPIKSVVFSGWTAHLDLIQLALNANGITYTRLDGKMSRSARGAALDTFRDDPSIHVILVSITAGGLGLNLTTANKVYVMEPQYNPAAEAQAVDRVHRLGQKRPVDTIRYIMDDSFEEKMLELQEKKKKLASLSMDSEGGRKSMDKAEAARKRLEDLKSLFK